MGKIKGRLIRRTGDNLETSSELEFSPKFEHNKKVLGNKNLPSKKIRNQVAGYLTRVKRQEFEKEQKELKRKQ
jgi:ribosomal protein S17E